MAADLLGLLGINTEPTVQEDHELNLGEVRRLEARTFNGSITVRVGTSQPHLTVRRKGEVSITLEPQGDSFLIEARKNAPICKSCGASFELTLPEGMTLVLHSSNGAIETQGSLAGLNAHTSNGAVTVKGSGAAELRLHTSNGRITVAEAGGPVSAKTSNGRIEVSEASGNVRAVGSNGRIDLVNVRGQVEVSTSNSSIRLEGLTLPPGSRNSARTSNGSIEVIGPAPATPVGMVIRGNTSNGRVTFSLLGFEVQTGRTSFIARQAGEQPTELTLQTSNGSISVR